MMWQKRILFSIFCFCVPAFAGSPLPPCHTRSHTLGLIKNCYTGDMGKTIEGDAQFFGDLDVHEDGTNYCYNHFVIMEQKTGSPSLQLRVLRDGHSNHVEEVDYTLPLTALKDAKEDTPYVTLKGLSGKCHNRDSATTTACSPSWKTWIGLRDRDLPLTLALGKNSLGSYTVSHVITDRKEIKAHAGPRLLPTTQADTRYALYKTVSEIRGRLVQALNAKLSALHQAGMTPKKLSESSEQFRYCAMALETYLKEKKIPDQMASNDRRNLSLITDYMNSAMSGRVPASKNQKRARQLPARRY